MIKWNEVTWYSKLLAVIFFLIIFPAWTFYLGIQYEKTQFVLYQEEKTITNSQGITFRYPEQLRTMYIRTVDWPPHISITESSFTCIEAGDELARAGETQKQTIGSRVYCLTKVTEGAAGSLYTQYAYTTAVGSNKVVTLTFSLRFVQCGNYSEQRKIQCEKERETFDINALVDRIVSTI